MRIVILSVEDSRFIIKVSDELIIILLFFLWLVVDIVVLFSVIKKLGIEFCYCKMISEFFFLYFMFVCDIIYSLESLV